MQRVGRYEIVERLGIGGMAEVLLGRATGEGGFEKLVAVKRILPHMAANDEFVRMFIDEARIAATLNHSNIAQIFEFGRDGESFYIAMELVLGVDLRAIQHTLHQRQRLPPPEASAYLIQQVCGGLEHAHAKRDSLGRPLGIIHRDVSPSNVLVSFEGEVKLIDFGIAKAARRLSVTVGAHLKGKYAYMSPEQADGQPIDHRSDLFAAGTLLFELLTGLNPFLADSDLATLERVRQGRVPMASARARNVPPELDQICWRALARDRGERFATAAGMHEALESFTRRAHFSGRQMARWMKESFPDELARLQRVCLEARQRPAELASEPVIELSVQRAPHPARGHSSALELERPIAPPGQVQAQRVAQPLMPVRGTPVGPAPTFPVPVATRPPSLRTRWWPHVVGFSLFAAVVAVVVYLVASRSAGVARPAAGRGAIQIRIQPAYAAQVFVDDELHGALVAGGVYSVEQLPPGKHRVALRGGQFHPVETVVEVVAGQTVPLELEVASK